MHALSYNVKKIFYPETGLATVVVYNDIVGKNKGRKRDKSAKKEKPELSEEKKDYNLWLSVQRSKKRLKTLFRSTSWSLFCTFTFDKRKVDRYNFDLCCKKMREWLQNIKRLDGCNDLKYIAIPEMHKKPNEKNQYAWHMHAVIDGLNPSLLKKTNKKSKGRTVYNLPAWAYGWSTAVEIDKTDPDSILRLSNYVCKYLTKQSLKVARQHKNKHRFFASQNIPKPVITEWTYENKTVGETGWKELSELGFEPIDSYHLSGYVPSDVFEFVKREDDKNE